MTKKRRPQHQKPTPAKEADTPEAVLEAEPGAEGAEALEESVPASQAEPPSAVPSPPGEAEGAGTAGVPLEIPREAVRRLEDELDELQDRHARLAAEFDNYRKRVNRERVQLGDRAQGAFAIRLLDVLDDLDRILAGTGTSTPSPAVHEALVLVDKKFRKELETAGLERIDPVGERFDPSVHEAVAALAPPTPEQDDHVAATFQAGYLFKGTLIRPARVQVYSDQGQG
ncbi:MAG: nucleotide exchange factor GrpE [Gemmatimonadales bacterium]|nr:nucleotide exchange factor GrpE [Gemmatimonadales bacterium]